MNSGMLVAIPICQKDFLLAQRNLERCIALDKSAHFTALVGTDQFVPESDLEKTVEIASKYFTEVRTFKYVSAKDSALHPWPRPQNWAWQAFARYIESNLAKEFRSWFWWEADADPLKPGWVEAIWKAHQKGRRPFTGHLVNGRSHMNGVAVYPSEISQHCERALIVRSFPFDVVLSDEVGKRKGIHDASHVIGHALKRFGGDEPTEVDKAFVKSLPETCVIFHGCKRGTETIETSLEAIPTETPSLIQFLMAKKFGTGRIPGARQPMFWVRTKRVLPKIYHVTERHKSRDQSAVDRSLRAQESWIYHYQNGTVLPRHVWNYPRSSASMGDKRELPYLKDVLAVGLTECASDDDVVLLTNDDTFLHRTCIDAVLRKLEDVEACASFRLNFPREKFPDLSEPLDHLRVSGKKDLGRDLFALRSSWLKRYWSEIPDYLLGELEWDLVLSVIVRKSSGVPTTKANIDKVEPKCELEHGLVIHEIHQRSWTAREFESSKSKRHNQLITRNFYADAGMSHLIDQMHLVG